jgi:hypothetical protein
MLARLTALLALGVAAANALVVNNATVVPRLCGSNPSAAEIAKAEAHFAANKIVPSPSVNAAATATINVYYHVSSVLLNIMTFCVY